MLDAQRAILLIPAMLIEKTSREKIELSKHWRIPLSVRTMSMESLGRVSAANVLDAHQPDAFIIDEAHRVKNKKAAVTRRYCRYLAEHPETKVVAMSGTMCKHSMEDYAHLAHHALKDKAPVPNSYGEIMEWAEVLDEGSMLSRVDPGALIELCNEEEKRQPRFQAARLGYQRRLLETPGVVSSQGAGVDCSLYINAVTYDVSPVTEENFRKLRTEWLTPDDWPLVQAVDVWRHARELAAGMHYVWSPRPPKDWSEARSNWFKFVREVLSHSKHLDSPHQVELAVVSGEIRDGGLLEKWKAVEHTFKPRTQPMWHDDSCLNFCEEWGRKHVGIIWSDHSYFGRELARRTGWNYFGREGINEAGVPIDLPGAFHEGKTIIASRKSNATGRNLQAWNRSLVVSPPGGADELEQLIAREHRPGQKADEVNIDLVFACAEHVKAWQDARAGAEMVRDTLGQQQKILMADSVLDMSRFQMYSGHRWSKTLSEKEGGFVLPKPRE